LLRAFHLEVDITAAFLLRKQALFALLGQHVLSLLRAMASCARLLLQSNRRGLWCQAKTPRLCRTLPRGAGLFPDAVLLRFFHCIHGSREVASFSREKGGRFRLFLELNLFACRCIAGLLTPDFDAFKTHQRGLICAQIAQDIYENEKQNPESTNYRYFPHPNGLLDVR
jgi:hypothetical protein